MLSGRNSITPINLARYLRGSSTSIISYWSSQTSVKSCPIKWLGVMLHPLIFAEVATIRFHQDLLGFPLVATWSEADELFGANVEADELRVMLDRFPHSERGRHITNARATTNAPAA